MSVELNWHEGEELGDVLWEQPETPAAAEPARTIVSQARPRPGRSRAVVPFLLAVLVGVLIGGAALAAFIAVSADQGRERARQDIETAVGLLLETQRTGDVRGYAQLLDPGAEVWRSRQIAGLRQATLPPVQASVQSVQLQGDLALAELLETHAGGGETTTRSAFFRQSSGQWLLTAPVPEQFGRPAQVDTTHFQIEYRRADEPMTEALVDLAEGSYITLCGELRCRASERPIRLVLGYDDSTPVADGALHIRSPRLLGVDSAGHPGMAYERALIRALATYMTVERFPAASPALQSAVADWAEADLTGSASAQIATLLQAARRGDLPSLDGAWQLVARQNRGGALEATQVASMFAYAQETLGAGSVGRLLEAAPGELSTVLPRAFDVSSDEFEAGWQQWLQAGPPDASRPA